MGFELLDFEKERSVFIDGVEFLILPLDEGGRIRLGIISKQYSESAGRDEFSQELEEKFVAALSERIVAIKDARYSEWSKEKIVRAMTTKYRMALLNELFGISKVGEADEKN